MAPAGSSTTVRELNTHAVSLPGLTRRTARTTRPCLSRKSTSISNLIPKVWTCLQRGKTRASPSGSESRPRRPLVLSLPSRATRASVASVVPRVALVILEAVFYLRSRITRLGDPTEIVYSGTSCVTTEPAPMTEPSPMVTPLVTTTPAPSQQSLPMDTGP
jgi:hypothetical protein